MSLRSHILRILHQAGPYQFPEGTLFDTLSRLVGASTLSRVEFNADMAWLKDKAYIDFTVEELSGEKRWALTAAGRSKFQ